jgi:hypothetical protein
VIAFALLALLAGVAASCQNPFKPTKGSTFGVFVPPPSRTTATGVIELLEWAYERRDFRVYETLFTEDYQFFFDPNDSAGNQYRQDPWIRTYELSSARHLFEGGSAAEEQPASSITLDYAAQLQEEDTGDGLDPVTHRRVVTPVYLEIQAGDRFVVQGTVEFYVVRADSAKIPPEIAARITPRDWLIYGWVDRTLSGNLGAGEVTSVRFGDPEMRPAAATRDRAVYWGWLKDRWRR